VKPISNKEVLLNCVALAFPLGGISELTRRINVSYQMSYDRVVDDPRISRNDVKIAVGHKRRDYINTDLIQFAEQYPNLITWTEKMEGDEGHNNRVELVVENFLLTHHHHTKSEKMPEDFINLSALYKRANATLNDDLQLELFAPPEIVGKEYQAKLLNLVLLHEKSREGLAEVGNIEFVFPKNSEKFITLTVTDLVEKQGAIADLDSDDLFDFKRKTAEEFRRMIG
jgi:hypothetical protein